MYDKIEEMLVNQGFDNGAYIQKHNNNGAHLYRALEELFHDNGFDPCDYSIDIDTCFSSCSYDTGYCAIAWLEQNRLVAYNFQWEVR